MKLKFLLAAVVLLAIAAVVFWPKAAPKHLPPPPPSSAALAPRATAPDWTARIARADARNFAATMDDALAIADPAERRRVVTALAVRWLNTDRMTFVAYLEAAEVDDATDEAGKWDRLIPALREAFAQVDEKAAASPVFNDAVQKFVEIYAGQDAKAARAWAEASLLGDARDQAMATIIDQIAADDPAGAQALLATIRQPYRRIEGLQGVAAGLAGRDPAAGFAWANQQPAGVERALAVQSALTAIAEKQPRQAAQYLQQFQTGIDAEAAAALAKVAANPPASPPKRGPGPDGGETQMTPRQAIEENRRDQLGRMADSAAAIAESWAAQDPAAAQAWAAALPAGPLRAEAVNAALAGAAERDPAAAFAAYRATPRAKPETASTIFEAWAAADPTAATAQVDAIGDPAARAAAVDGLVTGWAQSDDGAAEEWVQTLPTGADRDAGLASLAAALADNDPQTAWQKAGEIQSPARREAALGDAFAAILDESPDAAKTLLARANVSDDVRQKLQRDLDGATLATKPKPR